MKISGFISYSHEDGKDLVDGLDTYLIGLFPNFQPIYDEDVPEGEKLEKIKENLLVCDVLILIITPAALTSKAVLEEVKIAKEKGMKIIPCKNKFVGKEWDELPWPFQENKGIDFENQGELRRKINFVLSKLLVELEKTSKLKIHPRQFGNKENKLVIQIDKSVYMYNTDMICTIICPDKKSSNPINLKIYNDEKRLVYKNSIPINQKSNGIYQEIILIGGEDWTKTPGSEFLILAEYEGNFTSLAFYLANFGAVVELDQKIYTWTDKVFITIVAPDLNRNQNKVDSIGNNSESTITISTKKGILNNYELVETGVNTGIFTGEIKLTGFSNYDAKGDGKIEPNMGKTTGKGPISGLIECGSDDELMVMLKTPWITVFGAALIKWNSGVIAWMKSTYKIGDTATITVTEPDLNLNPDVIDMFTIHVTSEADPKGIDVLMIETGVNTGIFAGGLMFVHDKSSEKNSALKVSQGGWVDAEYTDRTLPSPYGPGDKLTVGDEIIIE